ERAFAEVGLDYQPYVRVDERLYRPAEVDLLVGDATKAREVLGWEPECSFEGLITEMVREDLKALGGAEAPAAPRAL
ncbi:MAG: GDP-mannose 4,6-dehydratase, partial [Acidobacteria bacterium]